MTDPILDGDPCPRPGALIARTTASGQLRNKATTAGNLLQRTRCPYFYDTNQPCNKRQPGSGCSAIGGFSRQHAIVGASCRGVHRYPSQRHGGRHARARRDGGNRAARRTGAKHPDRRIPSPSRQHAADRDGPRARRTHHGGDAAQAGGRHAPLSQGPRPRSPYAFALVSVEAIVQPDGTGRVALGGVAHKPCGESRRRKPICRAVPGL